MYALELDGMLYRAYGVVDDGTGRICQLEGWLEKSWLNGTPGELITFPTRDAAHEKKQRSANDLRDAEIVAYKPHD